MVKYYKLEVSDLDDELQLQRELDVHYTPGRHDMEKMFQINWDAQTIAFSANSSIKYRPRNPAQWGEFRTVVDDNSSIMMVEIRQGVGKFSLRSSAHSFIIDFERVPVTAQDAEGKGVFRALMRIVDVLDGPSL